MMVETLREEHERWPTSWRAVKPPDVFYTVQPRLFLPPQPHMQENAKARVRGEALTARRNRYHAENHCKRSGAAILLPPAHPVKAGMIWRRAVIPSA